MATVDLSKRTKWRRAEKPTGLAAVASTVPASYRDWYLEYPEGRLLAIVTFRPTGVHAFNGGSWKVRLCSIGPMSEVKGFFLKGEFTTDSEAKKLASKSYKEVASLEKYADLKHTLGWDRF